MIRKTFIALLFAPALVFASSGPKLDQAPVNPNDRVSLQRGAQTFVNYCLNCHSASYMRYNRLQDLGLTEQQIRDSLVLTEAKVGDTMNVAFSKKEAREWFGVAPPDLTVVARSRGADWLYTYLRAFYQDPSTASGWNNLVFPNVGMPHVLWQLQGVQVLHEEKRTDSHGKEHVEKKLVPGQPGVLSQADYDRLVGDLVNYLAYMGEPVKTERQRLGVIVLLFLAGLFVLAYLLKKEYWKDVH